MVTSFAVIVARFGDTRQIWGHVSLSWCASGHLGYSLWSACVIFGVMFLGTLEAKGRVWRVERDGSGDYVTLQAAEVAASPGDTILVGPGRYIEHQPFSTPGFTEEAYLSITTSDLTIIGADRDSVTIGPESAADAPPGIPRGIITDLYLPGVTRIQGLTVENVGDGMDLLGDSIVERCMVRGCKEDGISGDGDTIILRDSVLENNEDSGFTASTLNRMAIIERCSIVGGRVGIQLSQSDTTHIRRCEVRDSRSGIAVDGTSVVLARNTIEDVQDFGMFVVGSAPVVATGNVFRNAKIHVHVSNSSQLTGEQNRFENASIALIRFWAHGQGDLHRNEFLSPGDWAVFVGSFTRPDRIRIDLTNNYWGTVDPSEISALIWDGNDDPGVNGVVEFEPFADGPVPVARESLGNLKARFRAPKNE